MSEQRAITPEEVAERLSITPRMATLYLRTRKIPGGYKVAGQWRIDANDLDTFIQEQKRKTEQENH